MSWKLKNNMVVHVSRPRQFFRYYKNSAKLKDINEIKKENNLNFIIIIIIIINMRTKYKNKL